MGADPLTASDLAHRRGATAPLDAFRLSVDVDGHVIADPASVSRDRKRTTARLATSVRMLSQHGAVRRVVLERRAAGGWTVVENWGQSVVDRVLQQSPAANAAATPNGHANGVSNGHGLASAPTPSPAAAYRPPAPAPAGAATKDARAHDLPLRTNPVDVRTALSATRRAADAARIPRPSSSASALSTSGSGALHAAPPAPAAAHRSASAPEPLPLRSAARRPRLRARRQRWQLVGVAVTLLAAWAVLTIVLMDGQPQLLWQGGGASPAIASPDYDAYTWSRPAVATPPRGERPLDSPSAARTTAP